MCWVWVLLTAACGVALEVQQRELRAQAYAAEEACGRSAEALAGANADALQMHDAYQVCMDGRTITRPEGWTDPIRQPG
jgi:hypothetical protein